MATVMAPAPQEPTPVEIQQWQQGASNARQQYLQQHAQIGYQQSEAAKAYGIQNRQAGFNNQLQRQRFDDPYIGRGIFHSGIRDQGLSNMLINQGNDFANRQQQYMAQMGGYDMNDYMAMQNRDQTLNNLALQEQARRQQLASEIKGIT